MNAKTLSTFHSSLLPIHASSCIETIEPMAHSLTSFPAPTAAPIFTRRFGNNKHLPVLKSNKVWACHQQQHSNAVVSSDKIIDRRTIGLGLAGVMLGGLAISGGDQLATAAGKRPPPPPPKEKKDPTITGVTAKVLASKKRKEAMKEAVAKLRESGKIKE